MKVDASAVTAMRRALVMLQAKAERVVTHDGRTMTEAQVREAASGQGPTSAWASSMVDRWDRQDGKKQFPVCLPNGGDIETVEQVAAMLGTTKGVAARYVLETKGLQSSLYAEAKAMTPGDDFTDGVMVALVLDPQDAKKIALRDGIPPRDLHVTLGYWGDVQKLTVTREQFIDLCRTIARNVQPFDLTLNGITRFAADGDGQDPVVVNADAPAVEDARSIVVAWDDQYHSGLYRNHGYTPHMTLGYIGKDDPIPLHRWDTQTVHVRSIALHFGPAITRFALGQRPGVTVRRLSA